MKKISLVGLALSLVLLASCDTVPVYAPPAGETVTISANVELAFKQYQATIGRTQPGAFAVSKSGRSSYYYYCTDSICNQGIVFSRGAVQHCEAYGETCYVFANGHDAIYPYRIVN